MRFRSAVLVLLCAAAGAAAQDAAPKASGLAGKWKLNRDQSEDLASRIKEAAGSAYMSGGPGWATETWFPWGTDFSEHDRVMVRDFMLQTIPVFNTIEIHPSATEVQTVHGQGGVRNFYLTRKSAGSSALSGEKVQREAKLDGNTLTLESKGKEGRFQETYLLDGDRLVYSFRLEQKLLKAPLTAKLVYDRVP